MKITVRMNVDGLMRKLDLLVNNANDLNPPLRALAKFKHARLKAEDGKDWAPLAESTTDKLEHTRKAAVTAFGRLRVSSIKKTTSGLLAVLSRAHKTGDSSKVDLAKEMMSSLNRLSRDQGNAALLHGLSLAASSRAVRRLAKALEKAQAKTPAERKRGGKELLPDNLGGRRLLGRLPAATKATISKGTLIIKSVVSWAGVHQFGGSAGHGASIPARPFLFWDADDLEFFADAVKRHLLHGL